MSVKSAKRAVKRKQAKPKGNPKTQYNKDFPGWLYHKTKGFRKCKDTTFMRKYILQLRLEELARKSRFDNAYA